MQQFFCRLAALTGVSDKPGRIRAIEGTRGLAMSLVFFVHLRSITAVTTEPLLFFGAVARCGTDLFLFLCGFVVYESLRKKPTAYWPFILRRIWRIYPLYVTVLALYATARLTGFRGGVSLRVIAENLFFLAPLFGHTPLITVSWTLTQIMACYFLMPLIVRATAPLSPRERIPLFAGAVLVWYVGGLFAGIPTRPAAILLGVLANELRQVYEPVRYRSLAIITASAAFLVGGAITPALREIVIAAGLLAFAWGMFRSTLLSWLPMRCLGAISYSYYLSHGPVVLAATALFRPLPFWLLLPVVYLSTLLSALGLFLLVERPLSRQLPFVRSRGTDGARAPQEGEAETGLAAHLGSPALVGSIAKATRPPGL